MRRRLAFSLGVFAIVLLAIVLSVPWWLGPALINLGPRFGLTVESYQRIGYSRFSVRGVEYRRDPVVVKVSQAEGDTPFLWLWRRWTSEPGLVTGGEWSVDVTPSERNTASKSPRGWVPLQRILSKVAYHLSAWVPRVQAGKGVVRWPEEELTLSSGAWEAGVVTTPDLGYKSLHASVKGVFSKTGQIEATATLLDGSGEAMIRGDGGKMDGHGTWWGQPVDLIAQFEEQGWMPREASFTAKDWVLPADKVKLGKHYATVRGSGVAVWREGRLNTDFSVHGQPVANTQAPPLAVNLRGHGDDGTFVAEALEVRLPGINAQLSAPVAIDVNGRLKSEPSTFTVAVNLAEQPWFPAKGSLRGDGRISAGEEGRLKIDFSSGGEDISVADIAVSRVKADGQLMWPTLTIQNGIIATPDGSELAWQGGLNFESREVLDTQVKGRVVRALFARWLPEYPKFDALQIDAKASGPWESVAHGGHAEVANLQFQRTNPLAAKLDWNGDGLKVDRFSAEARAGETTLTAEGMINRERLTVRTFSFANGAAMHLQLMKPTHILWGTNLNITDLDLTGPLGSIRGAMVWGGTGSIQFRAEHISSEWFRPLFIFPATEVGIDFLEAKGNWSGGPAEFLVNAGVTIHLGKERAAQVSTTLKGSAAGLDISSLRVAEGGAVIVNATGRMPLVVKPAEKERWTFAQEAPFAFDAATSSNPSFWREITQLTGVEIVEPEVSVHLYGTLNQPRGEAQLSAARIAPVSGRFKAVWPKIEALKLRAMADNARLNLEEFGLSVEGQPVRISGQLPLIFKDWREVAKDPVAFVQRGEIRLEVPEAEIAAFVHYFPEYIAPKGRFQVDLTFQGEKALVGFIRLQNGTSRPLGPLGVLQEINADIRFNERTAEFQSVTARMGGQLVTLKGRAQLPLDRAPQLSLTLTGENLPFVRRSGLLVRGDLDLRLITPSSDIPAIQGTVRLRDSLFLADIRSFIPSGGAKGVAARPPYFALETPPLNLWGLDVKVEGEQFMRLRTPVFNGVATARFRLDGTLGEPRIAGEALVDEGNIRLPFASFEVRQGEIRLTAGQVEPQLYLAATTRRYGYDLRMELSGDASAPKLVFSSSPPLEAEQVLLMVMAGEAPSNEISTTDRQRVARFGAFFGQSLLGSLGGDPTGPERLTISSGGDISEQGRETYSIEYKLADRWAVTGEYDEFDDYYGGLKWRLFPKKDKDDAKN